jgi:hypothetical protein
MWDTPTETAQTTVPHDMSCPYCGHGLHVHLACNEGCDCVPNVMPGTPE